MNAPPIQKMSARVIIETDRPGLECFLAAMRAANEKFEETISLLRETVPAETVATLSESLAKYRAQVELWSALLRQASCTYVFVVTKGEILMAADDLIAARTEYLLAHAERPRWSWNLQVFLDQVEAINPERVPS